MPKINLTDLSNLQNEVTATAAINSNNTIIEEAIENSISRDGTQPNQMNSVLDMNSNRIINLPEATSDQEPVTFGKYMEGITSVANGAVIDGSFITLDSNPALINERILTAGPSIEIVDEGPGGNAVIGLSSQELSAIAGAGSEADKFPYYDDIGSVALTDLSSFARTLLDDSDAVTARATLGVSTGSGDLVAANNLSDVADITTARNNLGAGTGDGDLLSTNNLSDVSNTDVARFNIGAGDVLKANNLSDVVSATTSLYNLGGNFKRNRILNPSMQISQQFAAAGTTTNGGHPVDGFRVYSSGAMTYTSAQVSSVTPLGALNRIRTTITGADASVASTDYLIMYQAVEGLRLADLGWGTASAKSVTISFGMKAPAGTYSIALRNGDNNRSYVSDVVISGGEANTDVRKTVTIPGDTSGTWPKDTSAGMNIVWGLTIGSGYQTTADAWQAGGYIGTSSTSNFAGTNGNVFELFDVQLVEGSFAAPYEVPDFEQELSNCRRYYYSTYPIGSAVGTSIGTNSLYNLASASGNYSVVANWRLPTPMRTSPTGTIYSTFNGAVGYVYNSDTGVNLTGAILIVGDSQVIVYVNAVATSYAQALRCHMVLDARL